MQISSKTPSTSRSSIHSISPPCHRRGTLRSPTAGADAAARSRAFLAGSSVFRCCSSTPIRSTSVRELQRSKSSLESLFCYDKSTPEEVIEKPVGVSLNKKDIGNSAPCTACEIKGAVLCATCSGSGLYVDSILESQGVIVKVRCLGCGGSGNIMCSRCGGLGHL